MAEYDSKVVTGAREQQILEKLKNEFSFRIAWCNCANTGSENEAMTAYIVSASGKSFALNLGVVVAVNFSNALGKSCTLNINGTGAKHVNVGSAYVKADEVSAGLAFLRYDGTAYQVIASGGRAVKIYDGTDTVEIIPATSAKPLIMQGVGGTSINYDSQNNRVKINSKYAQGYQTCDTAEATVEKSIYIPGYELTTGGIIAVKFTNEVLAGAKLNVSDTGAKPIFYDGIAITPGIIEADEIVLLIYDGTNYNVIASSKNLPYSGQGYATCSAAAATAAKTVSLAGYTLVKGGMVAVKFTNAVNANATLNINSQGAKNIRYKGNNITNGVIGTNEIALFEYDGTYYNLVVSGPGALAPALQTLVDEIDDKQNHNLGDTNKNKVLVTDGSGNIVPSDTISTTELGYLDGLSGSINEKFSEIDEDLNQVNDDLADTNERIDDAIKDLTVYYGICNTAVATDAKTVAITNFTLETGRLVVVSFTNAVKAGQTLNVNNTGAKAIKWGTATLLTGNINAGDTCLFWYDGTDYVLLSNAYKFPGFTISPQTSSTAHDGQWEINTDALIGHAKANGAGIDISIPYASRTHPGVATVPASKTVTVDDVQKTIGNALQMDEQGNLFLPIAGGATGNDLGAVAPGVGVSVGEGGHLELNQADADNIGGMKLTNTTTTADQAKTDTTFTAYATSRLIDSKISEAQAGAAMFQGTGSNTVGDKTVQPDNSTATGAKKFSTLTDYKKGWYWVVADPGTYAGYSCESGDFIFCVADKDSAYKASDFTVVQSNLDVITEGEVNTIWSAVFG